MKRMSNLPPWLGQCAAVEGNETLAPDRYLIEPMENSGTARATGDFQRQDLLTSKWMLQDQSMTLLMTKRSYETVSIQYMNRMDHFSFSSSIRKAPVESHSPVGFFFLSSKRCMIHPRNPVHVHDFILLDRKE
jgi:hypothetical protein